MSVSVNFASANDSVIVNGNPPRRLNISGPAVTVTDDPGVGTCDIVITGGGAGTISGGFNLGTGVGIYKDTNGSNLEFKSLIAGTNISLVSNTNDITFNVPTVSNSNAGVVPALTGNGAQYLDSTGNWSTPAGTGTGEANTASNAGLTGIGIVLPKSGVNLPFKSIEASSNKITMTDDTANSAVGIDVNQANLSIAYSQLTSVPSTIVQTNQANTFGAFIQTFPSSNLYIENPAGTHSYIIAGSAITANRTVTLPLLTGNDTFTFNAFAATLTNKSMDGGSNTFTNIPSSALPSVTVYNNQANTYSASDQTIPSGNLKLSNSGFKAALTTATLTANQTLTFPNITDTVVTSTDSRMTNARTPTAHASTHESGGSDPIALDTLAATTDITTLNASTSAHGLLPKLSGTSTQYMDGTGAWSTPAGGGGSGGFTGVGGSSTQSGTASTLTFNIPHGLGSAPSTFYTATPKTQDADDDFYVTVTSTNVVITYTFPPPSGINNLIWQWLCIP